MSSVVIITGGASSEREVSLRSAAAVALALEKKGHTSTTIDLFDLHANVPLLQQADVAFPVIHGQGGEDGTIQAELESLGIKYVGSDSEASRLCYDKWKYKAYLREVGLPHPVGQMVDAASFQASPLSKAAYVLKPVDSGSSIDTFIIREPAAADMTAITASFTRHPLMLLEELIEGIEMTVGVLGKAALPVIEIIPPQDGEFDYENKYNGKTQELCPPAHLSEAVQKRAQDLALHAHAFTHCRDLSRTDIMFNEANDQLYILETNTIPGMTDQSLFPKAAAASGVAMPDLIDQLIKYALAR